MASAGWLCRRVACGRRNDPRTQKCECGARRPKKRIPAHRKALRDVTYQDYIAVNMQIHNCEEECVICGRLPTEERRLDRDHDHTTGQPHSGQPRGLVCVSCNILMPPKMTARKARGIAEYLERVEQFYARRAA